MQASHGKKSPLFPKGQLKESSVLLKTYTGERLAVVGDVDVKVQYKNQTRDSVLTVVTGNGPSLLGRNWLQHLTLNWRKVRAMCSHAVGSLEYLLDKYNEELGTIKSFSAKLHVKPDETPKFYKPRSRVARIPAASTMCPKYSTESFKNLHFSRCILTPACIRFWDGHYRGCPLTTCNLL